MKILHTADWHLGKWLDKFSRLPEQKEVLDEICEIAEQEKVDLILIAGDLFDTFNPSAESLELFYRTLKRLGNNGTRPVIAIAGNHDQPERIEAPDHLARECGIILVGSPGTKVSVYSNTEAFSISQSDEGFLEIILQDHSFPIRILTTPYANELRLKTFLGEENSEEELRLLLQKKWQQLADKYCDEKGVNILCSHLFFQKKGTVAPEEPEGEKPILYVGGAQAIYSENIPKQIQYTALGHLHRYQLIDKAPCPVVYSGSPLSYSFAEANQEKYVVLLEAAPGNEVKFNKHLLTKGKPLLRNRFESLPDALVWLNESQNALVEITMVTDDFLSVHDRKTLNECHSGIVNIVPEVKNNTFILNTKDTIDLNKSIEDLFVEYFRHQKEQTPDEATMELFKEVLGLDETI